MSSLEDRLAQYGARPKGLLPLRAGRVDLSRDIADLLVLIDNHEMPSVADNALTPWVGITTDGQAKSGLFAIEQQGFDNRTAIRAGMDFLESLSSENRVTAVLPIDSPKWRMWTNAFPDTWEPHGICLEAVSIETRQAALGMMRACLSEAGYESVTSAMRLNAHLGELIDSYRDSLTEWMYQISIFGVPQLAEPWGWQLSGHHVDINCLILDAQAVLTPMFLGAEPAFASSGQFAGTRVLDAEREVGFSMYQALTAEQRTQATLYPTIDHARLPHELNGIFEGRHLSGAGRDNRVIPYEGIPAVAFNSTQSDALHRVVEPYFDRLPSGLKKAKRAEFDRHLDATYFAWIGDEDPDSAHYYRVHSPVVLIEYDNHPGVFLDNEEPEPFHIHTLVRTPNGNDYGKDLLREHYDRHHRSRHTKETP